MKTSTAILLAAAATVTTVLFLFRYDLDVAHRPITRLDRWTGEAVVCYTASLGSRRLECGEPSRRTAARAAGS